MGPISETALQRAIARHYRLTVTALKPQGGIWKALTAQGCYIAKPMGRPPDELEELTRQLRRIQENGFREVALPVPTVEGKTFFDCGGRNYILTPFINGPAPSFSNAKHLEQRAALTPVFTWPPRQRHPAVLPPWKLGSRNTAPGASFSPIALPRSPNPPG